MNREVVQRTEIKEFRQWLRSGLVFGSCLTAAYFFMVASSASQAVIAAPKGIISLASNPRPQMERIARRPGDATFEKAPANYHAFAATAVGENIGVEQLTLNFAGETTLTRIKTTNKDFVIEAGGTCQEGNRYSYGGSCSLLVRFNPQGPGHRLGFIEISDSAEAAPISFGLIGNGYAPVVSFTPSRISTVPGTASSGKGTINGAQNLAIDGGDILYIPDSGNDLMKKIDSSGAITSVKPYLVTPNYIAVDNYGIIYNGNSSSTYNFDLMTPWGAETAYGYTYVPGTCTASAPCAFSAVGMASPSHLSIDAYDDLFFEEATTGAAEMPIGGVSGGSSSPLSLWHLFDEYAYSGSQVPEAFAVDASGNLYSSFTYSPTNLCSLLGESLYSAEYSPMFNRVAGGSKCGFSGDGGQARGAEISSTIGQIAFDYAGDLYFSDTGNNRVRRIEAGTGIIRTIAGNGATGDKGDNGAATSAALGTPTGLAVDSRGQVYILTPGTTAAQLIRKVGTMGSLSFASTAIGKSSGAVTVNVANTGNSALTFLRNKIIGANPADFSIDSNSTNCSFDAGNSLASGHSCQIGVIFKPAAAGARTASLNLVDNTINGVHGVALSGTATTAATVKFTAPATGTLSAAKAFTVSVKVSASNGPVPTGGVDFSVDGKIVKSTTLVLQAATANIGGLSAGTHQLTASYLGDTYHSSARSSKTITVTQ